MMRAWKEAALSHWRMGLALLAPILVFHWKIVLQGHWIQGGDFINQFSPWRHFALSELREGRFPFWNPYVFCGTPFAANIQTSLFYPENLFHLILPVEGVFSFSLVAHQALAALAMYGFLHHLVRSRAGALLGATVYAWSGFFITHAHDGHLIHARAYAFIPLALWAQSLIFTAQGVRVWAALAGFASALAMMFFAGHTQLPLYIFYALLFRAAWHAVARASIMGQWRKAVLSVVYTGTGLALSMLTAMLVLLPLIELSRHTASRAGGADYAFAVSDSMPPSFLVTFVAPFFYGDPTHGERERQFWLTGTGYHELSGYVGIIPLLLLIFVFLSRRKDCENSEERIRRWDIYFFLSLAGGGLFFALGEYNPLYPILYYGLPGWSYFRVPARLTLLFIVGVCVCSAWGLTEWRRGDWRQSFDSAAGKIAAALSCLLPLSWIILWLSKPGALGWLRQFEIQRTVETFGLWTAPRSHISAQLPEALFESRYASMVESLGLAVIMLSLGWIALLAVKWHRVRSEGGVSALRIAALLPAAVALVDLMVFSHRFIPTQSPEGWVETHYPRSELVEYLLEEATIDGARVIELDDAIGHPGLAYHPELRPNRPMGYGIASARGYDPLILERYARHVNRLYNRPEDQPQGGLLFFTEPPASARFASFATPYVITTQPMSEPYRRVWEQPGSPVKVYRLIEASPEARWESGEAMGIDIVSKTASRIELRLQSDEQRRLVWAQTYYPGWRATLNEVEVEVEAHEEVWMSVRTPEGDHALTLFYDARVFVWGAALSAVGAIILGVLSVIAIAGNRKLRLNRV